MVYYMSADLKYINHENYDSLQKSTKTIKTSSPDVKNRKLYFVNEDVEWLLTRYLWSGCTSVELRDKIMANAPELIRQIIRKRGLHTIYPGQDESSFNDLIQTAWIQIEKVLYKYRSSPHCRTCYNPDRPSDSLLYVAKNTEYGVKNMDEIVEICNGVCPHCGARILSSPIVDSKQGIFGGSETILYRGKSKVFNMWSQIATTVILAFAKKDARDRKNSNSYQAHLSTKIRPHTDVIARLLREARDVCKYHTEYDKILDSLEFLIYNDERPHDGLISKLAEHSGSSRVSVGNFMKFIRFRSLEFSDSPANKVNSEYKIGKDREEEEDEF